MYNRKDMSGSFGSFIKAATHAMKNPDTNFNVVKKGKATALVCHATTTSGGGGGVASTKLQRRIRLQQPRSFRNAG